MPTYIRVVCILVWLNGIRMYRRMTQLGTRAARVVAPAAAAPGFSRLRANYYNSHNNDRTLKTNIADGSRKLIIARTPSDVFVTH